jgi:hypothetical protein
MKSVCRLGAVEFGFKVFSFHFHPQKRTKVKDSRPWINTEIRKNVRKLQRLYKQKKKTGDQNTKEKYNQLKHHNSKRFQRFLSLIPNFHSTTICVSTL